MKKITVFACMLLILVGCARKSGNKEDLEVLTKNGSAGIVEKGDSYARVVNQLGRPNVDSISESSRVLVYDDIEVKLVDNAVTEVFDFRKP